MPLVAFQAGQTLTAADLNAALDIDRTRVALNDQPAPNTTLLANPDLALTVAANSWYRWESEIFYDALTAADLKFDFTLPSGAFFRKVDWGSATTVAATDGTIVHNAADTAAGTAGGLTGSWMVLRPSGLLVTFAAAGSMQFRFAQNTSNATPTILKGGSSLRLVKVV